MPEAKKKAALDTDDFYEVLYKLPDKDRVDYIVRVERIEPEYNERNQYVGGYLGHFPLTEFLARGEDTIMERFGGNVHTVEVRGKAGTKHAGQYVCRTTIRVPGVARVPTDMTPGPGGTAPGAASSPPAGRSGYDDGYKAAMEDARRQGELKTISDSIKALENKIHGLSTGNGNGRSRSDFLEAVEAVGKLKDVLGIARGEGGGLGTLELIKLLENREAKGESRAKEIFELLKQYAGEGGSSDGVLEGKMLDLFTDMIRNKNAPEGQGASSDQTTAQIVMRTFGELRDGLGDVLAEFSAFGASAIKGSKTPEELYTNVRQLLQVAFKKEENAGEEQQPGEPGEPPGSPGAGGKDDS